MTEVMYGYKNKYLKVNLKAYHTYLIQQQFFPTETYEFSLQPWAFPLDYSTTHVLPIWSRP